MSKFIDLSSLLKVILFSTLAGLGITVVFCGLTVGLSRRSECRSRGESAKALVYTSLSLVCALVCALAIVYGFSLMAHK